VAVIQRHGNDNPRIPVLRPVFQVPFGERAHHHPRAARVATEWGEATPVGRRCRWAAGAGGPPASVLRALAGRGPSSIPPFYFPVPPKFNRVRQTLVARSLVDSSAHTSFPLAAWTHGSSGQSQQRRPHLPFNPIWRCNVWVPEWKDHPGGPISQTSRWTLLHGPSNALWPIER